MELILRGHDLEYEAQQIILLFFPNHDRVKLVSEMTKKENSIEVYSEITAEGRKAFHTETAALPVPSKKELANLVKLSAYYAAAPLSPLSAPWGILTGIRPVKPMREMLDDGVSREEVRKHFKETYLVREDKLDLALRVADTELRLLTQDPRAVSIYIGIPFCPTRCLYCSFISGTGTHAKMSDYVSCLTLEIKKTARIIKELGLYVKSVYIGGGTPTALTPDLLKILMDSICSFDLANICEFTVEAGRPDTITYEKLEILKNSPADRISINPQTLHDDTLALIGRQHSVKEFFDAFSLARSIGFNNINVDLIAGLPGETPAMFSQTCDGVLNLSPESLTIHTLYIKRASYLKRAKITLPSAQDVESMLRRSAAETEKHGLFPYYMYKQKTTIGNLENVGYSKAGCECLYNMTTMSDFMHIFALGAGGVSKLLFPGNRCERVFNYKFADEYIKGFDEILKRKEKYYEIAPHTL